MTSVRGCLAVLALVMVTCACGNEGSTGSTTPTPRHTGSTTPPTQPPPSTPATAPPPTVLPTTPPTTPSPNSSTSTSTSTSTTTAPITTSTLPLDDQIEKAIQDYFTAYAACVEAPRTCDPSGFLAEEGDALDQMVKYVEELIRRGVYLEAKDHGSFIRVLTVQTVTAVSAVAESCVYDSGVLLGPPGLDGKPTVVDNSVVTNFVTHELRLVGSRWLVASEMRTRQVRDVDACSPPLSS